MVDKTTKIVLIAIVVIFSLALVVSYSSEAVPGAAFRQGITPPSRGEKAKDKRTVSVSVYVDRVDVVIDNETGYLGRYQGQSGPPDYGRSGKIYRTTIYIYLTDGSEKKKETTIVLYDGRSWGEKSILEEIENRYKRKYPRANVQVLPEVLESPEDDSGKKQPALPRDDKKPIEITPTFQSLADQMTELIGELWERMKPEKYPYYQVTNVTLGLAIDSKGKQPSAETISEVTIKVCSDKDQKDCQEFTLDFRKIKVNGEFLRNLMADADFQNNPEKQQKVKKAIADELAKKYKELEGKPPPQISPSEKPRPRPPPESASLKEDQSTVLIETKLISGRVSTGSGTVVKCEANKDGRTYTCHALTASHVVFGLAVEEVQVNDTEAKVLKVDSKSDIALISFISDKSLVGVKLGDSNQVKPGDKVKQKGYPEGSFKSADFSVVACRQGVEGNRIVCDQGLGTGSSGGGIYNEKGDLVGVASFVQEEESGRVAAHYVSSNKAAQLLDKWGFQRLLE